MTAQIAQDGTASPQNNQITLVNTTGAGFAAGEQVKVYSLRPTLTTSLTLVQVPSS